MPSGKRQACPIESAIRFTPGTSPTGGSGTAATPAAPVGRQGIRHGLAQRATPQTQRTQRIRALHAGRRPIVANQMLSNWRIEARRRAKFLGAPSVWQLANDPHIQAVIRKLNSTGELLADLRRVCAEAIADVVDHRMLQRSSHIRLGM
jgi:hypothetical protein